MLSLSPSTAHVIQEGTLSENIISGELGSSRYTISSGDSLSLNYTLQSNQTYFYETNSNVSRSFTELSYTSSSNPSLPIEFNVVTIWSNISWVVVEINPQVNLDISLVISVISNSIGLFEEHPLELEVGGNDIYNKITKLPYYMVFYPEDAGERYLLKPEASTVGNEPSIRIEGGQNRDPINQQGNDKQLQGYNIYFIIAYQLWSDSSPLYSSFSISINHLEELPSSSTFSADNQTTTSLPPIGQETTPSLTNFFPPYSILIVAIPVLIRRKN